MADKLMVYMVTQERMGSPEAVVIYFAPIKYHLQKALPISYSQSQSLCLVTQREGVVRDKTKRLHGPGDQFPTSQAYLRRRIRLSKANSYNSINILYRYVGMLVLYSSSLYCCAALL